jgi:hypothetical protein
MSAYINYLQQYGHWDATRQSNNSNYYKKDNLMYECINKIKLTGVQFKLMEFIIRHTHGENNMRAKTNKLACNFSYKKAADELCIDRNSIPRALKVLVEKKMITMLKSNSLGTEAQLNTALDTWDSLEVQAHVGIWIMNKTAKRLHKSHPKSTNAPKKKSKIVTGNIKREVLVSAIDVNEIYNPVALDKDTEALLAEM